eukprot:28551_1
MKTMEKSFLSIFNIFGNDDDKSNNGSDADEIDDNKSDGCVSDNDDNGDVGTSNRKKRRSKRRKKKSKKKKHRKSLTSDNDVDISGIQKRKGSDVSSGTKYKRGLSVQESAKPLKNTYMGLYNAPPMLNNVKSFLSNDKIDDNKSKDDMCDNRIKGNFKNNTMKNDEYHDYNDRIDHINSEEDKLDE